MKNIDIFPWDDNFNTGIETIDAQHRKLVKLLNRLATLVAFESSKEILNEIFDELTEYTLYHFETEEAIWHKHLKEDPLYEEHKAVHQKFIDGVQKLKSEQEIKPFSKLADEALGFLARWLASHILESDRYMAHVVKALEKGLNMDAAKKAAHEELSGSNRVLIEIILSIYSTLSANMLNLAHELQQHTLYEEKVAYQDRYRDLLIELATSFINLPLDEIDTAIQSALEKMATFISADRAYIFDFDFDAYTFTNTYEWCAQGITPQIEILQNLPLEMYSEFLEVNSRGEHCVMEDVDALPQGALRDNLVMQDIQSLITFALMEKNRCVGMVGFDAVKEKRVFVDEEIVLLKLFSALLANVTDRKELELANQEALLSLNKAQSMAKMGNWTLEHATGKLKWSDEVFNIFEIDKEQFGASYEAFLDVIHPEDREMVDKTYTNSLIMQEEYSISHRLLMKDGRVKCIQEQCENSFDAEGNALFSIGTVQDITQRKKDEEGLRLAASVFTHTHEAILITSPQNEIIDANSAVERITGYTKEELIGKNPKILSSGQHSPSYYKNLWSELTKKGFWSGEIWNRRKNGDSYAEFITISTVKDDENRVLHYVAMFSDLTSIKEQQKRLEYMAHYDTLTGLPNRVLLSDRLEQAMMYTHRNKTSLALVYLDLDGFKEVNDTHGHESGDKLLKILADRMKQILRESDTVARLGGDEFVVVLSDLHAKEDCVPLLQKLLDATSQSVDYNGISMQVSASIGVSFFDYDDKTDADQLLRYADQAMYQAKLTGKNRFYIFDAAQDATIKVHHEKLQNIENALVRKEFALYYQPKVNMRSGEVVGLEALIRWQHPAKGTIAPGEFLPVIEGNALSVKVGEWVLKEAINQIAEWKSEGLSLVVSINIDALHLLHSDFIPQIKELLIKYPNVNTSDFMLEILETSALENISEVIKIMEACQALDISFSLDDFGTGYSSLTYLKRLPASELKIDKSFVRDMLCDPEDLAILDGVIGLANSFGRKVIAEGVEEIKQGEFLVRMGCEVAQGYVVAKPMPAIKVQDWVLNYKSDPKWTQSKRMSRDDLPILYASVEHTSWVQKVVSFARGSATEVPEQNYHECRFGRWFYSLANEHYAVHPKYSTLEEIHIQVHNKAREIIQKRAQGIDALEEEIQELEAVHFQIVELLQEFID